MLITWPTLGKYLIGMGASLLIFLAGGWLILAPFALGYQPYGADWVNQTTADFATGIPVAVVALVAFAFFFASLLGALRAAGVLAARKPPCSHQPRWRWFQPLLKMISTARCPRWQRRWPPI